MHGFTRVENLAGGIEAWSLTVDPAVPLVLQPVTPMGGVKAAPEARALLETLWRCEAQLQDVRLIPQTHRMYGAL